MSAQSVRTIGEAFEEKRNNFHLIRLLAALAVIYGHAYAVTASPGGDLFLQWVGFKFIGGVAVDIFFVISGFLITGSLERSSAWRYIWARCLRIFPALFVAVTLSVVVLGPLFTNDPGYWSNPQTWKYWWSNALMWRTEYFLPGVFQSNPDAAVNGSLWAQWLALVSAYRVPSLRGIPYPFFAGTLATKYLHGIRCGGAACCFVDHSPLSHFFVLRQLGQCDRLFHGGRLVLAPQI